MDSTYSPGLSTGLSYTRSFWLVLNVMLLQKTIPGEIWCWGTVMVDDSKESGDHGTSSGDASRGAL